MKRLSVFLVAVVVALVVISPAQSFAGSTASVLTAKHLTKTKKHRKHKRAPKPAPEILIPHVISVNGETVSICDTGGCDFTVVTSSPIVTATAECPPGYSVIAGGWESDYGQGPHNASFVQNHPVSNRWLVTVEAAPQNGFVRYPRIAYFHAVAQCQILLPA